MARIEGFRVENYRSLKNIGLGRLSMLHPGDPLTPITAVIGKNGVGKSALFDALGFLSDCLKFGAEEACNIKGRGGFDRIRSQGAGEPIGFEIYYRETEDTWPVGYLVDIDSDDSGRPFVSSEFLVQYREEAGASGVHMFLLMEQGAGVAWKGSSSGRRIVGNGINPWFMREAIQRMRQGDRDAEIELIDMRDKERLAIATLGALKQHPRITSFRHFLEGWHLSYFTPGSARQLPLAGSQKYMNSSGDNLANVVQFMKENHPENFEIVLRRIADRIPGIDKIDTEISTDGRLLLRFDDKGFTDPFYAQQMSDGTLKLFAYLIMLEHPHPPPFICIEEPENGLYPKLLEVLAREFRDHAMREEGGSQVFVTTHQPYFVDGLAPEEVWILEKGEDGFSTIRRASDDPVVRSMTDEGLPLGSLWYSDYLDPR